MDRLKTGNVRARVPEEGRVGVVESAANAGPCNYHGAAKSGSRSDVVRRYRIRGTVRMHRLVPKITASDFVWVKCWTIVAEPYYKGVMLQSSSWATETA